MAKDFFAVMNSYSPFPDVVQLALQAQQVRMAQAQQDMMKDAAERARAEREREAARSAAYADIVRNALTASMPHAVSTPDPAAEATPDPYSIPTGTEVPTGRPIEAIAPESPIDPRAFIAEGMGVLSPADFLKGLPASEGNGRTAEADAAQTGQDYSASPAAAPSIVRRAAAQARPLRKPVPASARGMTAFYTGNVPQLVLPGTMGRPQPVLRAETPMDRSGGQVLRADTGAFRDVPESEMRRPMTWSDVIEQANVNLPASGYETVIDILKGVNPYPLGMPESLSPMDWLPYGQTVQLLAGLGAGGVEKVIEKVFGVTGPHTKEKAMAEIFFGEYADRYGGMENLKRSLAKNPAGVATDLLTVLHNAGLLAKVPKLASMAKTASSAQKTRGAARVAQKTIAARDKAAAGRERTIGKILLNTARDEVNRQADKMKEADRAE